MSTAVKLAIIAVLGFAPVIARAQTAPPSTLAEAQQKFREADAELNKVWQRCVSPESATVQSIAALRAAQQTWAAFRDQNARAYQLGQSDRRPLDDEYYAHGRTVMTLSRIGELKSLFGCE